VRYQIYAENSLIRGICDEGPHADHILSGIEKAVAENIKIIEVDLREVGRWCK
jgi:hypothetical protein